jgi:DNA-binding LytR/AlgR family response regulator
MKPLKVLIVEDDNIIAEDLKHLLQDIGYQICGIADNGQDAIQIFQHETPDIALVDIQVNGEMDGIDIVRNFNTIKKIPIVFLTAQADFHTVERAKSTKPAAYLLKPFDERHLHISIDLALSNFISTDSKEDSCSKTIENGATKLSADMILMKGDTIFLKQNYKFVQSKLADLMYIEADGNHSVLCFKQHKVILRLPLSAVTDRLNHDTIVRVHRSFAINISMVEEFDETQIVMQKKSIPFSPSYREAFLQKFNIL